ncbi:armadillo repeat protein [Niveomyces insectorum RCEF 264]|uniref:Armadillo repeat protein n=1 Tax=Niveomyces insectorum RCEF 264 TaxID=1081102 RepID=A0A167ZS11_9HYPO|nr:armadillo repeat protein [Niveomyces insectorum RCEF 264]
MVLVPQGHAMLETLQTAQSYAAQSLALRSLKNETVGHVLKKEKWVQLGVLRPIVKVLLPAERPSRSTNDNQSSSSSSSSRDPRDARDARDSYGLSQHNRRPSSVTPPDSLPPDELARLQALELLGIFASGGPSFLPPLHAAGALPAILAYIDPHTTHLRLVFAALRSLLAFARAAQLVSTPPSAPSPVTLATLAEAVFAPPAIHALHHILTLPSRAWWVESCTNAALTLIPLLCRDSRHQTSLSKAGVLEALAVKIASYVVAQGQVVPGADVAAEKEGLRDAIPEPASPQMDLAAVLAATATVLGDVPLLRACILIYAPSILAIFPQLEFESSVNDIHAAWKALSMGGLSNLQQPQSLGALDLLLPAIPSQQTRSSYLSHSAPFPPLGMSLSRDDLPALARASSGISNNNTKRGGAASPTPYGRSQAARNVLRSYDAMAVGPSDRVYENAESPMIPWLISLVRSTSGMERLTAASVLTLLYKAGLASRGREAAMALLIVPLLMRMLDDAAQAATAASSSALGGDGNSRSNNHINTSNGRGGPGAGGGGPDIAVAAQQAMTELALIVLARLVTNSDVLQKAAVDCNAIKILAKLLKEAYEPVPGRLYPRPWNPTPTTTTTTARTTRTATPDEARSGGPVADVIGGGSSIINDDGNDNADSPALSAAASKLGPAGQSPLLAYRIRLREAVLKALTALLASKYDYQKIFVEQDAMLYVVASLSPTPSKPQGFKDRMKALKAAEAAAAAGNAGAAGSNKYDDDTEFDPEYGRNGAGVLVAACNCVRMLSRSIAILRTTLEDAGVATPIFRLLRHPDLDVQIAATGVVCNLVTETSPMRERYAEAGIMNILCDHAHSLNKELRLNALWALKHFVDGVEPSMKKACLEQLGADWLVQLIDPDNSAGAAADETASGPLFARLRRNGKPSMAPAASKTTTTAAATTAADGDEMDEDVEMEQFVEMEDEDEKEEKKEEEAEDMVEESNNNNNNNNNNGNSRALSVSRDKTGTSWTPSTTGAGAVPSPSNWAQYYPRTSHERSSTGRLRQAEAKIAALREMERGLLRRPPNNGLDIQEQGLNFVRNLIGPGAYSVTTTASSASPSASATAATATTRDAVNEATEMIDYLFRAVGQDRLFRILLAKLRGGGGGLGNPDAKAAPHYASPAATAAATAAATTAATTSFQVKIVEAVVFILVHISASVPRHRQLVVAQTELLRALAGQFASRDKGVRVALCHLVTNLTWRDDAADTAGVAARTQELKRLGLLGKLQVLQQEDAELDVREQAKMAVHQMGVQNL